MKANAAGFRSSGIYETIMPYGDQQYRLFEVVDQGATMSKHMHYLEDSLAIIFFYDMAVYNHMSLSIPGANAFNTAVKQFRSATKSKWFAKSSIILFLNNVTKFREKILHSPLGNYFPDYPGDVSNTSAAEYIVQRFTKANEASLPMYVHWVDPGDPKTVKLLADTVDVIHTEANLSISIL
jgi:guanine nucleotide-binding protein subunit alpha